MGRTMPQRSLHPLVYILLMWLTIISIVQVVFIAFFFTLGQNGQSSSHRAEEQGGTNGPLVGITSPFTPAKTISEQGTVLNYKATTVNESKINWYALKGVPNLISEKGRQLHVKKDGYYFLSLRVTLEDTSDFMYLEPTVILTFGGKPLLEGWIDRNTNSSGQLSKVKKLPAGEKLEVIINPPKNISLITNESMTYLDIIFMPNL